MPIPGNEVILQKNATKSAGCVGRAICFLCLSRCCSRGASLKKNDRLGRSTYQLISSNCDSFVSDDFLGSSESMTILLLNHLRCYRSFKLSVVLQKASCPVRWSYPNSLVFVGSSLITFQVLYCLTQAYVVWYWCTIGVLLRAR